MALPDMIDLGGLEEPLKGTPGNYPTITADQRAYLEKVRGGRNFPLIRPDQPAFSPAAEMIRQVRAIDTANAPQNEQGGPETGDQSVTQGNALPDMIDLTEGQPGVSTVTPKGWFESIAEAYQKYRPQWQAIPPPAVEPGVVPQARPTTLIPTVGNLLGETAAPFATARDVVQGAAVGKPGQLVGPKEMGDIFNPPGGPSTDWRQNIIPGLVEGLSEIAMPMGLGRKAAAPVAPIPRPPVAAPIGQAELDSMVAFRSNRNAIQNRAFPDPEVIPATRVGTGSTLVTPDLTAGEHLTQGKYKHNLRAGGLQRTAKGLKIETPVGMTPGEFGAASDEGQLSLLGGYNVQGEAPYLTGKYPLTPGEQTNIGMLPLREQQRSIPQINSNETQALNDALIRGEARSPYNRKQYPKLPLNKHILTLEEERALYAPEPTAAERGAYPVDMKTSATGRAVSTGPRVDESYVLPKELNVSNTADGAVFTSLNNRGFGATVDVMKKSGPLGEAMGSLIDAAYTNRATGTSKDMVAVTQALDSILGNKGLGARIATGTRQLLAGENPFIFGSKRHWNLSGAEEESLFNYMYTQRKSAPLNDRVRQAGEALFEHGLYPASSDPGVRTLQITNPFTGKKKPLGEPGMFMPQQPVNPIATNAINDTQWGILYERAGGEKLGISQQTYRDTIIKLSKHDPDVTAFKMKGLENMRLLDLDALGGSPYQWAKKLGYETDPFRATFRFNSLARLRGQLAQIEQPLQQLLDRVPSGDAKDWLKKSAERALLNPGEHDSTMWTSNTIKGVSHLADITMLQLGGLANIAQAGYATARAGPTATLKGFASMFNPADRQLVEQSGAVFPAALNELTNPSGPMATWSSGAFRLYGLSAVDRNTRYFAGHVGNKFIQQTERNFLASPGNTRLAGLLSELGGNPEAILQAGKIPEDMRLGMIQKFANMTAGVTDVRGVPLWATSENPWARLVNKYRTFALANGAEVKRLVQNAPTPQDAAQRVATLLTGGYALGTGINEIRTQLRDTLLGGEAKPKKEGVLLQAERLTQGLGTVQGMILLQLAERPEAAIAGIVGGPVAGVAGSLIQDLRATAKYGPGWRTIDTLSKRAPVIGPILGPIVGKQVSLESKREAYRQSLTPGEQ